MNIEHFGCKDNNFSNMMIYFWNYYSLNARKLCVNHTSMYADSLDEVLELG